MLRTGLQDCVLSTDRSCYYLKEESNNVVRKRQDSAHTVDIELSTIYPWHAPQRVFQPLTDQRTIPDQFLITSTTATYAAPNLDNLCTYTATSYVQTPLAHESVILPSFRDAL